VSEALKIVAGADHVRVEVHVVPRASRSAIVGVHDGRIKVTLDAPPVDGEANAALIAFFAKALKRPKRDVTLVRGDTSRHKTLALRGVSEAELRALLERA
jgi:uncharacterized protein (TIGR00251 family)